MALELADPRDQEFLLYEVFDADTMSETEKFADFNMKTGKMLLKEARNLAVNEILPTNKLGDVENGHPEGIKLENGQVYVPPSYHTPYKNYCEGGWLAMCDEEEWGGQGMPHLLAMACGELFTSANCAFLMYPGLTHGCGNVIKECGSEEMKQKYLKKVFTGEWGGTMCLTEANAGSDVGALETVATKNDDGTYNIVGNKIFISGGDSDLVSNVIHPVLARIEGAPAGTKGISLFLVPKYRVNEDGSVGESNDVETVGIEEKMGIHGNATCSLAFGSKGNCIGELIGEENKGMKYMFLLMNEARQGVALQGLGFAAASYSNAVNYAKERIQGPALLDALNPDPVKVPIIQHPDVRRQLLLMKSYVEGCRYLCYYLSRCFDKIAIADSDEEKDKWNGLIEILTPIAKSYCTDKAVEVASSGVQIYGGYGFIEEYPQAQLLRDCRITMIYEGTNGIQAMDLLGRKLGMKKGKLFMDLTAQIAKTIGEAKKVEGVADMAASVENVLNKLGEVAMHLGKTAMSEKVTTAFAYAHPFLEATGDVCSAWMLLWRATIAQQKLGKKKKDDVFYNGVIKSAQYFINSVLPITLGKMQAILDSDGATVEMDEASFVS
jgi:alkylation response protein AidB-like acyl-CoA dehydrogenase